MDASGLFQDRTSQLCNLQSTRSQFQQQLDQINHELECVVQRTQPLLEQQKKLKAQVTLLDARDDSVDVPAETLDRLASFEKEVSQVLGAYSGTSPTKRIRTEQENTPVSKGRSNKTSGLMASRHSKQLTTSSPRHHGIDLATEIGEGLVEEVRRLQARLLEKDELLKELRHEKEQQERGVEETESRVRLLTSDEEKLKSVNWELEMRVQEMEASTKVFDETRQRLEAELSRANALNMRQADQLEAYQDVEQKLNVRLDELHATNANTLNNHKEVQNDLRGEIAALQRTLENAKIDLENERLRMTPQSDSDSPEKMTESIEESDEGPETPIDTPPISPIKGTPHRNATLEFDTMKGTLYYNQAKMLRQRKELEKEKSLRMQLQRQLQDTEDELTSLRQFHDSQVPRHRRAKISSSSNQRRGNAKNLPVADRRPVSQVDLLDEWGEEEDIDDSYTLRRHSRQPRAEGVFQQQSNDSFQKLSAGEDSCRSDSDGSTRSISPIARRRRGSHLGPSSAQLSKKRRNSEQSLLCVNLQTELDGLSNIDSPNSSLLIQEANQDNLVQISKPEVRDTGTMTEPYWREPENTFHERQSSITSQPELHFVYEDPSQSDQDMTISPSSSLDHNGNFAEAEGNLSTYDGQTQLCPRHDTSNETTDQELFHRPQADVQIRGLPEDPSSTCTAKPEETVSSNIAKQISSMSTEAELPRSSELQSTTTFPVGSEPEVIKVGSARPRSVVQTEVKSVTVGTVIEEEEDLGVVQEAIVNSEGRFRDALDLNSTPNSSSTPALRNEGSIDPSRLSEAAFALGPIVQDTSDGSLPIVQYGKNEAPSALSPFASLSLASDRQIDHHASNDAKDSDTVTIPRTQWDELIAQREELQTTRKEIEQAARQGAELPVTVEKLSVQQQDRPAERVVQTSAPLSPDNKAGSDIRAGLSPKRLTATDSDSDAGSDTPSFAKLDFDIQHTFTSSPTAKAERVLGKSPDRSTLSTSKSISHSLRLSEHGMAPPMAPSSARDTLRSKQQSRGRASMSTQEERARTEIYSKSNSALKSTQGMPSRSYSQCSLSSVSSFASEIDDRFNGRFNMPETQTLVENPTDPATIESITRTMIGMSMYKYTRLTARQGLSENRHKRYFWIHPYTKTLYWSVYNPVNAPEGALIKSAPILSFNIEEDHNTMPPGLHQKSICIGTPRRTLKMTAVLSVDHDDWIRSLNFLIYGPPPLDKSVEAIMETEAAIRDFSPRRRSFSRSPTRQALRGPAHETTTSTEAKTLSRKRSKSTLSGKVSALFSRSGPPKPEVAVPSSKGKKAAHLQSAPSEQLTLDSVAETLGLENVRSCCNGRHDVSDLCTRPGSSSRASSRSRR